jgi:hypothetical protein
MSYDEESAFWERKLTFRKRVVLQAPSHWTVLLSQTEQIHRLEEESTALRRIIADMREDIALLRDEAMARGWAIADEHDVPGNFTHQTCSR